MSVNEFQTFIVRIISTCCRFGLHACIGDYVYLFVCEFSFQVGGWEGSPLRSAFRVFLLTPPNNLGLFSHPEILKLPHPKP